MTQYLISTILFCTIALTNGYTPWNFNGSTPGLMDIVMGRCYEFQSMNLANHRPEFFVDINCTVFWEKFSSVFANNDSCAVNFTNAYNELLDYITNKKLIKDKAMFWSGTKTVAHDFSYVNNNYYTLEDTFPGYFADNLKWCGCANCPQTNGINFDYCNTSCDATKDFWDEISKNLATKASGTAYVMLNGTTAGWYTAYYRGSIFGKIELPNIGKSQKVELLKVLVVNDVDKPPKETCGTKSLLDLQEDATKYNISIECIDDPPMVRSILCAKYPNAHECKTMSEKTKKTWKNAGIALIAISVVLLLAVIFLLVMFFRKSSTTNQEFTYQQHADA